MFDPPPTWGGAVLISSLNSDFILFNKSTKLFILDIEHLIRYRYKMSLIQLLVTIAILAF